MGKFTEKFAKNRNNSSSSSSSSGSFASKTETANLRNIYLVRGDNQNKKAWYYVKVDPLKVTLFLRDIKQSSIDLSMYGEIIHCGWGENPPQDLIDKYGD
jgi:hypothetical protein